MPFGLATGPAIFARVVSALMSFLYARAIRINPYLHDWMVYNASRQATRSDTQVTLDWSVRLGFIPSVEKSSLVPAQILQ